MADEAAEGRSVLTRTHNSHFPSILQASLGPNIFYMDELIDIYRKLHIIHPQLLHIINTQSGHPLVDKALILIELLSKFEFAILGILFVYSFVGGSQSDILNNEVHLLLMSYIAPRLTTGIFCPHQTSSSLLVFQSSQW